MAGLFVGSLGAALSLTALFPPGMSYTAADSVRTIAGVAEDLNAGVKDADCVVIFDGSSSSRYALDHPTIMDALRAKGHRPCVVYLVLPAGEHLEREWMAEQVYRALEPETRRRLDKLPILWAKEMLWLYETLPARFAAENRGTDRLLACSSPSEALLTLRALWTDWRDGNRNARKDWRESWEDFSGDRMIATINHGCFNLFQCGRLTRLSSSPVVPLRTVADTASEADHSGKHGWWNEAPAPDAVFKPSSTLRPRRWFKELVTNAPSGWPKTAQAELVLYMQPVANVSGPKYGDLLQREGPGVPNRLFNGQADESLRRSLYKPELWRDTIHLNRAGAVVFSKWLVDRLEPALAELKGRDRHAF